MPGELVFRIVRLENVVNQTLELERAAIELARICVPLGYRFRQNKRGKAAKRLKNRRA